MLNLASQTQNMEKEAKAEEEKDKEMKAEIVRKTSLKKRLGITGGANLGMSGIGAGTAEVKPSRPSSATGLPGVREDDKEGKSSPEASKVQLREGEGAGRQEQDGEVLAEDGEVAREQDEVQARTRASE